MTVQPPKVHCITNYAAMNLTANMLLCVGATPSLSLAAQEVGDFVASSQALLINLGTLDDLRLQAIPVALQHAKCPIVLDPVMVERSPFRLNLAKSLLGQIHFMRCNAQEFKALSEGLSPQAFALKYRMSLVITGEKDLLTDGRQSQEITGGHQFMTKVTALGCAGGAVIASFLARENSFHSALKAIILLKKAGEKAGEKSNAPASFQVAYLDALYQSKF